MAFHVSVSIKGYRLFITVHKPLGNEDILKSSLDGGQVCKSAQELSARLTSY